MRPQSLSWLACLAIVVMTARGEELSERADDIANQAAPAEESYDTALEAFSKRDSPSLSYEVTSCLTGCDRSAPSQGIDQCKQKCLTKFSAVEARAAAFVADDTESESIDKRGVSMSAAVDQCAKFCKNPSRSALELGRCMKSCVLSRTSKRSVSSKGNQPAMGKRGSGVRIGDVDVEFIDPCYVNCYSTQSTRTGLYNCWARCIMGGQKVLVV